MSTVLDDEETICDKKSSIECATRSGSYRDPGYWDKRFATEEHYEWLKDYSHFEHLIRPFLRPSYCILELGCGNSHLSERLHSEGVADITCIDLSSVAVKKMLDRLKAKGLQGIKVIEADMLNLPFNSESFDIVIEKGAMDVLFVGCGDPWNPKPDTVNKVMKMLEGVHNVLKPDGIFISISFGQPHFRRPLLEDLRFTWSAECKTFGEGFHYFFYILKKSLQTRKVIDIEYGSQEVYHLVGMRSTVNKKWCIEKFDVPSVSLFQDELEGEDFIFRIAID